MNAPDLNPCPCCDTRLAPVLTDTANDQHRMSFGVWVMCPGCEMAGPRTWLAFAELGDLELADAQAEAARRWNAIAASVSTIEHLLMEVAQ